MEHFNSENRLEKPLLGDKTSPSPEKKNGLEPVCYNCNPQACDIYENCTKRKAAQLFLESRVIRALERINSKTKRTMTKYVGRTCEACGATSEIQKWVLTDEGLKCPACGNVKACK